MKRFLLPVMMKDIHSGSGGGLAFPPTSPFIIMLKLGFNGLIFDPFVYVNRCLHEISLTV
jgi:hypothetical protein